jgi:hypothetical protein
MFEKGNIGCSVYAKSKSFDRVTVSARCSFQVEHDADTSNFDFFPEDDAPEPEDDLTGWDKEF